MSHESMYIVEFEDFIALLMKINLFPAITPAWFIDDEGTFGASAQTGDKILRKIVN